MRIITMFLLLTATTVWAQRNPNNLPNCPEANSSVPTDSKSKWYQGEQTANWNECWGLFNREVSRGISIASGGIISSHIHIEEYEGEWKNGLQDGTGQVVKYEIKNGRNKYDWYYFGIFKEGKPNGIARYVVKDSNRKTEYSYEGEFKNGEFDGRGTEIYFTYGVLNDQQARKFIGNWTNGKKNGRIQIIEPEGKSYFNTWIDGKFMGS